MPEDTSKKVVPAAEKVQSHVKILDAGTFEVRVATALKTPNAAKQIGALHKLSNVRKAAA